MLEPHKKELITALVSVHLNTKESTDIVAGKGNGLVLLLHGPPGTDKTLTAETVAELAEKPLYRVTCGDIAIDPRRVEKYFGSVLYIGTIWSCVVLLDEADVFLEERTHTDLQRNALVSIFLRILEFCEGILILTTNRVGTFDEALKSRIQLAIEYPKLKMSGRREIWRGFIDSLRDSSDFLNIEELEGKLESLADHELNGRQTRNIIKTARQLARYKKEPLAYIHVDEAINVASELANYVARVRGHTDEECIASQGIR